MKLRQIAEAAVYVSAHGPTFIDAPSGRPEGPLVEFWLLSRHRLQDWTAAVDERLLSGIAAADEARAAGEPSLVALLDEIFVAEVLARVWSAVVTAADGRSGAGRYERLVRNVFIGHLQARHRALSLIADGRQLAPPDLTRLDQIRRRAERWTDVLLGHLVGRYGVEEFAFDAARAREFGRSQRAHGQVSANHPVWGLILGGLRLSFPDALCLSGRQSDRSRSLAAAAVAMIPDATNPTGSQHRDGETLPPGALVRHGDRLAFARLRGPHHR